MICYSAVMLNPTSPELLVDSEGNLYFLWDSEMTLDEFRQGLRSAEPEVRAYLVGKLMEPDDVFTVVSLRERFGSSGRVWSSTWASPGSSLDLVV